MALSLGVTKGSKVEITLADRVEVIQVKSIDSATQLMLVVEGKAVAINDKERVEILPQVFVSCGLSRPARGNRSTRLAFEAPLEIKINRVKKLNV